uniref:Major tail protein n=1 Tax=Pseudomonas phage Pavpe01 TaxID=3138545 RepID=A0AAU6W0J4_9VIRU
MVCDVNKLDSNQTGLSIAEEECLKQLPVTPVWYGQEPNTYSDFGGELSSVARAPIDPSRQRKKGTITDLDASGGFNTDVTENNMIRLMQGFCFADARQQPSTAPINGAKIAMTGVDGDEIKYTAASGLAIFQAGNLVLADGFAVPTNNGLKKVSDAIATAVTVWGALSDEGAAAKGSLSRIGHEFAAADVAVTYTGGVLHFTATAGSFGTFNFLPGQWLFFGGDAAGNSFAVNKGFGRVGAVSTDGKTLTIDQTTWTPATEAATGISLQIFFGTVVRNEKAANLIKRRSYQLERTLGQDADGMQAEYLTGAVANEFTLNIPQADKLNADLTFVACDNEQRTGLQGMKTGTRIDALGEDAYNTSSDVYRIRMTVVDPSNPNPNPLFGYVSEGSIEINNNVTPNKAVGVLGAFDTSAGNFEVGGSVTAYFTTVSATQAVRNNADVGLYAIMAARNAGMIYDVPLLSLGGGRINVEKDNPITVPLDTNGAESKYGHTLLVEFFPYLPNLAMPQ